MEMPGLTYSASDYRYGFNSKEKDSAFGLLHYDYGFRIYHPGLGRFLSVDPLAGLAPGWTPYRFGFNNPLFFIDPDGLFEDKASAEKYTKDHKIKLRPKSFLGRLFTSGSRSAIVANSDGTFSIDNKLQHTSISDLGGDLGIVTATLITPDDLLQPTGENDSFWQTETIRKRSQEEPVFTDRIIFIPELGSGTKVVSRFVQAGFKIGKAKRGKGDVSPADRDPQRVFSKKQKEEMQDRENGICPNCGEKKDISEMHGHHKVRHADGGKTSTDNGVNLCTDCHRNVHKKD